MPAKKSFRRSEEPALAFINTEKNSKASKKTEAKPETIRATPAQAPEGYKLNPLYVETKSRRVQALVQPSIYEAVKAKAQALGISTNEAINEALRAYTEEA